MELNQSEVDYMIGLIKKEIISLYKIRTNIKKFAFNETKNCQLLPSKFNSLIDEVSRISVEISILEQKKKEYLKIKECL